MVAGPGFTPRTHPPRPVLSGNTVPLFILLPPFFLQLRKQRQKEVKGLKLAAGLPTPEPWLNQAASIFEPWLPVLLSWEQKSLFTSSFVTLLFCDLGGVSHLPPPQNLWFPLGPLAVPKCPGSVGAPPPGEPGAVWCPKEEAQNSSRGTSEAWAGCAHCLGGTPAWKGRITPSPVFSHFSSAVSRGRHCFHFFFLRGN